MARVLSAIQPFYLPWIGTFILIGRSDVCVLLDDVQFVRGWQNRNRFCTPTGLVFWVTIPVARSGINTRVRDALVATRRWRRKHWNAVISCYKKCEGFEWLNEQLGPIYTHAEDNLQKINTETMHVVAGLLDIRTTFILQSQLNPTGRKTEMLIDLCRKTDCNAYVSGPTARNYIDAGRFAEEKIDLLWSEPPATAYRPAQTTLELPLSIVDTIAHFGVDETKALFNRLVVRP